MSTSTEEYVKMTKSDYNILMSLIKTEPLDNVLIFTGRSCKHLDETISKALAKPMGKITLRTFGDGSIDVTINESIRDKQIFIIQTGTSFNGMSINDYIIEAMEIMDACNRGGAGKISYIAPCFPYQRADKKDNSRVSIGGKMVMNMISTYASRISAFDLHASQIQGFVSKPVDNMYCVNLFCDHLLRNVFDGKDPNDEYILISPDLGAEKRIMSYSKKLHMNYSVLSKQRNYEKMNTVDVSHLTGNPENIIGKTGIIIDDIIDSFGTMLMGIAELKKHGIKNIIVIASHGILSGEAINRINNCDELIKVIVTNTVPQEENLKRCQKLEVIDIGQMLSEVIKRVVTGESLSALFN